VKSFLSVVTICVSFCGNVYFYSPHLIFIFPTEIAYGTEDDQRKDLL